MYKTKLDSVVILNIKWLGADVYTMFANMARTLKNEFKTGLEILTWKSCNRQAGNLIDIEFRQDLRK